MKTYTFFIWVLLIAALGFVSYKYMTDKVNITIPIKKGQVSIKDPLPIIKYDTIYKDSIIIVKDQPNDSLLKAYNLAIKLNDSLLSIHLYKEAITERTYSEQLIDSTQTITVNSLVIGTLKHQEITYVTNPITFFKKKDQKILNAYIGLSGLIPTDESSYFGIGIEGIVIHNNKLYKLGIDSRQNISIGLGIKLW